MKRPRGFYIAIMCTLWLCVGAVWAGQPVTLHAVDGVRVYGTLTRASAHNDRVVLLFHQAMANRHEYDDVVPALTALGYDTLAIDQRSGDGLFGGQNQTVAELGKSADYLQVMPDLEGALAWARAQKYRHIVTVGSSYSAALVIVLAANHSGQIDALASFSPGEYFADKNMIKNAAAKIAVPFYITTDPDEETAVDEVLAKAHGANVTRYKPRHGVHGASTLVESRDAKGWRANLDSFVAFLRSLDAGSATPRTKP